MAAQRSAEPPTVLVVDDDGDLLEVLQDAIAGEGYGVIAARNGEDALDLLRGGATPCVILLDLKMPGMGGEEFRRRQLDEPHLAGIPVVGFTGLSDVEARRLALASYLRKPVKLHVLLETIAHYCSDPDHVQGFVPVKSAIG